MTKISQRCSLSVYLFSHFISECLTYQEWQTGRHVTLKQNIKYLKKRVNCRILKFNSNLINQQKKLNGKKNAKGNNSSSNPKIILNLHNR